MELVLSAAIHIYKSLAHAVVAMTLSWDVSAAQVLLHALAVTQVITSKEYKTLPLAVNALTNPTGTPQVATYADYLSPTAFNATAPPLAHCVLMVSISSQANVRVAVQVALHAQVDQSVIPAI